MKLPGGTKQALCNACDVQREVNPHEGVQIAQFGLRPLSDHVPG